MLKTIISLILSLLAFTSIATGSEYPKEPDELAKWVIKTDPLTSLSSVFATGLINPTKEEKIYRALAHSRQRLHLSLLKESTSAELRIEYAALMLAKSLRQKRYKKPWTAMKVDEEATKLHKKRVTEMLGILLSVN